MCYRFRFIPVFVAVLGLLFCACGEDSQEKRLPDDLKALLDNTRTINPYDEHLDSAPDDECIRMRVHGVGQIGRMFNDSNHVHLEAATSTGIKPISDSRSAWDNGRGLVAIKSCPEYFVDELTHSYPYLTHNGASLLKEIGHRFNDSLQARGGGCYRIKVTSVLRTPLTVGKLRRVNRNATETSAHQYGATFDISYSKFICDSDTGVHRTFEDMKNLLAKVINDLRDEGRCFVKHERKQACFHITARPEGLTNDINYENNH